MKSRLIGRDSKYAAAQHGSPIIRLLKQVAPYKGRFIAALGALFVGSAINLVFPELLRRALDPQLFPWVLEHLDRVTALLAVLFIVQGAAFFSRSYLFGIVGQRVFSDVRLQLFRSIIGRDALFFDRNRSGDLAARINSDAALVQEAVSTKLSVILRYGIQVLCGTVLMAFMSWRMTCAIIISILCIVGLSSICIKSLKGASRHYQNAIARLTTFVVECFSGAKIVDALGAHKAATQIFSASNSEVLGAGERRTAISAGFSSGASLMLNLLLLLVQWYGIHLVVTERLPLNNLAAFVLYGAIVAVSFSFLIGAYAELMQSLGGLERVLELINEEQDLLPSRAPSAALKSVEIEIKELCFAYPDRADSPVLEKLSFSVAPGKMTALVGPSGAGKSSIAQLLLRFYAASSGELLVNGVPIADLSSQEIRSSFAWVPQEPYLFGFTLYENLVFGNEQLTRADVLATIRTLGFLDFAEKLPNGFDTQLGEQGAQLSGGERQRLAIARAILRNPSLLILDEATSGLDSTTEEGVLKAIRNRLPAATLLIISHRLSTVRAADTIVVINEGTVFEEGRHEELKTRQGLYQQYVARQALD